MHDLAHTGRPPKERLQQGRDHLATLTEHPPARDDLMATVRDIVKAAFEWGWEAGYEEGETQARESVGDWHDPRPMGY